MPAFRNTIARFATATVLVGFAAACGGGGGGGQPSPQAQTPQTQAPALANQWAGRIEGTDTYISVFTLNNGQTGAYLANGKDIAALLLGSIIQGSLRLRPFEEIDISVDGTVAESKVDGTVTIRGKKHPFTADRATGYAGWYRGRTTANGQLVTAGYILLADGTQKGAIRQGDKVLGAPAFDPTKPTIQAGGVSVDILPVAEFVKQEGGLA
jgi:hypothetical protein